MKKPVFELTLTEQTKEMPNQLGITKKRYDSMKDVLEYATLKTDTHSEAMAHVVKHCRNINEVAYFVSAYMKIDAKMGEENKLIADILAKLLNR